MLHQSWRFPGSWNTQSRSSSPSPTEKSPRRLKGHETRLSGSTYSLPMERLNEINNMLRDSGIEKVLWPSSSLNLPRLVVIGNQGHGKSSLMESIAKIKLPRAQGTTTRCPMEIILRTSEVPQEPEYRVSVRYESDKTTGPKKLVEFATTQNLDDLRLMIKRAQILVLNPGKGKEEFLALDEHQCESYKSTGQFSEDVVLIEVAGAQDDITFVDLPGLIAFDEKDENRLLPDLIEKLSCSYCEPEESLILVVATMEGNSPRTESLTVPVDLNQHRALDIARKYDKNGKRTRVVLTKADQIKGENATKHWLDIFKSDQKEGKYFVTMLATSEDGTEEDEETILKKKPFSEHQPERKGVQTLTTAISVHLAEKIRNRLPALAKEIENEVAANEEADSRLPPSFSNNPQDRLIQLCVEFIEQVRTSTSGAGKEGSRRKQKEFVNKLHNTYSELSHGIEGTRPKFQLPPHHSEAASRDLQSKEVIPFNTVQAIIKESFVDALPSDILVTEIIPELTLNIISEWQRLSFESFEKIQTFLKDLMENLCEEYFRNFEQSTLLEAVKGQVEKVMVFTAKETRNQIDLIFKLEKKRPYIQNKEMYLGYQAANLAAFISQLPARQVPDEGLRATFTLRDPETGHHQSVYDQHLQQYHWWNQLKQQLTENNVEILDAETPERGEMSAEYKVELTFMSSVLAYFEMASERVAGIMPMIIEGVYIEGFTERLRKSLISKLKLTDEKDGFEICRRYTKENDDIADKRKVLADQRKVLFKALEILKSCI